MFCLSTSGDICIPVYLSILTNTEYEKSLLLENTLPVLLYEIQIQQQFLLHHYIFQFELLNFLLPLLLLQWLNQYKVDNTYHVLFYTVC